MFDGVRGHRVRSCRHGADLSQGVVFPLDDFPEIAAVLASKTEEGGGDAVRAREEVCAMSFEDMLGVRKWEAEVDLEDAHANLGPPPGFIVHPGCARAQNVLGLFGPSMRSIVFQVTEKLDGVSMTIYKIKKGSPLWKGLSPLPATWCCPPTMEDDEFRFGVCSRAADLVDTGKNLYWETAKSTGVLQKVARLPRANIAVHGELCGSSVMDNGVGFPEGEHCFFAFDIWDLDKNRRLPPAEVVRICEEMGIPHVPIYGHHRLDEFAEDLDALLAKADGVGLKGKMREGLVFKSLDGKRQFKAVSNTWLIKTGK